jgi:putative ABC transport system permease protein
MNLWFTVRIACRALLRNRLRSLLTMLGIIIGVAAVISMLSIGNGAQIAMQSSIEKMGTNTITIEPGYRRGGMRGVSGSGNKLVEADWLAIASLPGIQASSPVCGTWGTIVYGNANWNTELSGVAEQYDLITNWSLQSGRMFNEAEVRGGHNVVVLGTQVRDELFGAADPVGATIRIQNFPFRVIGLLTEKGDSSGGWGSQDNRVLIPYTTVRARLTGSDQFQSIIVKAESADDIEDLQFVIKDILNTRYKVKNPEKDGFQTESSAEASETAAESAKVFSYLLGGIASVSLLVGGIGIMNIMLVSVTERIREIGIRMAVGARGRDILGQFLVEAIVLSLIGGGLGVALGSGISIAIARMAQWPAVISQASILLAFGTSAFIGIFFGFYPALSASQLDPIEALRSE